MLRAEERGGEASLSPGLRLGRECWEGSGLASRERRREAVQCKVPESHTWEGARGRAGQQPRPRATAQDQRPALRPLSPARSAVPAAASEAGPSVLGWTLKSTWVSRGATCTLPCGPVPESAREAASRAERSRRHLDLAFGFWS